MAKHHGISRLPEVEGDKTARRKFKSYPLGYFHINIAEVRTEEGKLYLLVAVDLWHLVEAVPYKVHTVLTDNPVLSDIEGGTHYTDPTGNGWMPEDIKAMRAQNQPVRCHAFEAACADLDIKHRLTKPRHPWTNGQVERMN